VTETLLFFLLKTVNISTSSVV